MPPAVRCVTLAVIAIFLSPTLYAADTPSFAPNSDPTYQQLRNLTLGNEAVSVSNVDLKGDAGIFHLRSGTVCFVSPVKGKVTGAVFVGDGSFVRVDDKFRMMVPIYLEMPDGRTGLLGRARLVGNTSVEQKIALKGWKTAPKRGWSTTTTTC
jgi:hypothetical protein